MTGPSAIYHCYISCQLDTDLLQHQTLLDQPPLATLPPTPLLPTILRGTRNRKLKTKFWKIFSMLCWGSPSPWTTNYFHNRFAIEQRMAERSYGHTSPRHIKYLLCLWRIKPSLCTEMDVSSVVVVSEFIRYAMANMNFGNFWISLCSSDLCGVGWTWWSWPVITRASNEGWRRFHNHRKGPSYGLLLVESAY